VARKNMTRTAEFQELVDQMQEAGVKVVGSVLVDAPFKKHKPPSKPR
jgi:hypothetical protein